MPVNSEAIVNNIYSKETGHHSISSVSPGTPTRRSINSLKSSEKKYDVPQLKQSLESWKLVLVSLNNLIEWEGKFDPVIIITMDTFIFGILMYYNPSILSTISIIGISMLLIEILLPILISYIFKSSEW